MGDTLLVLLTQNGLKDTFDTFKNSQVSIDEFRVLSEVDLAELGFPLGVRKKLVKLQQKAPAKALAKKAPVKKAHEKEALLTRKDVAEGVSNVCRCIMYAGLIMVMIGCVMIIAQQT